MTWDPVRLLMPTDNHSINSQAPARMKPKCDQRLHGAESDLLSRCWIHARLQTMGIDCLQDICCGHLIQGGGFFGLRLKIGPCTSCCLLKVSARILQNLSGFAQAVKAKSNAEICFECTQHCIGSC